MKKIISLLVATATALSVSVAAFAADETPGLLTQSATDQGATGQETTDQGTPGTFSTTNDNDVIYLPETADNTTANNNAGLISPRIHTTGINDDIRIGVNELFLVERSTGIIVGVYNHLIPDKEYTFRVYYNNTGDVITVPAKNPRLSAITTTTPPATEENTDGVQYLSATAPAELTGTDLNGGTVRLRTKKGSNYISGARVKTTGRGGSTVYDVVITTRAQYGTSMNDVEYILSVSGYSAPTTGTALTFEESQHSFEVGWPTIRDEDTQVGEDGVIVISNDAPVITKDQFADISRSANYKNVSFEGEDAGWAFTGRTSGMASSNLYYTYDVVPEIINKFPDQDYKFLSFKGGVTFPSNGEMRIDVSDLDRDYNTTIYTYLYRNGKLTRVNTTYNSDDDEIVFRTNYLGTFMMTNVEITDTSIIAEDNVTTTPPKEEEEEDRLPSGTENPATGASSMLDIGVTLGLVTLVAAGAVSRKKK